MTITLLTSPAIRRLNGWRANRLAAGDVNPLGDRQKFASVPQQGRASQALAGAMLQESLPSFGSRARTMPRDCTGILEQSLEHCFGISCLNEGGPTSIRDLVLSRSLSYGYSPLGAPPEAPRSTPPDAVQPIIPTL